VIGFTGYFNTRFVTTINYSAIADFHTLQITTAHAKSDQSAFTCPFPVTHLNNGDCSTAPTKPSVHIAIHGQSVSQLVSQSDIYYSLTVTFLSL
jgi:hypothetical protein